jgi:hypothetical protein
MIRIFTPEGSNVSDRICVLFSPATYTEVNTAGDLLAIRVDIQNNLKNPMQKTLDNEIRVTGSQLEEWKALLDKLVLSALQDIQPRDT